MKASLALGRRSCDLGSHAAAGPACRPAVLRSAGLRPLQPRQCARTVRVEAGLRLVEGIQVGGVLVHWEGVSHEFECVGIAGPPSYPLSCPPGAEAGREGLAGGAERVGGHRGLAAGAGSSAWRAPGPERGCARTRPAGCQRVIPATKPLCVPLPAPCVAQRLLRQVWLAALAALALREQQQPQQQQQAAAAAAGAVAAAAAAPAAEQPAEAAPAAEQPAEAALLLPNPLEAFAAAGGAVSGAVERLRHTLCDASSGLEAKWSALEVTVGGAMAGLFMATSRSAEALNSMDAGAVRGGAPPKEWQQAATESVVAHEEALYQQVFVQVGGGSGCRAGAGEGWWTVKCCWVVERDGSGCQPCFRLRRGG